MATKDVINEIKDKLDIVSVVSEYLPELKQSGLNHFARCPFHNEKTPSFSVNSRLQKFKCFGCGESGDVISFIQKIENIDFPKALEISAKKAGIDLSRFETPNFDKGLALEKKKIFEVNKLVADFFHYILLKHPRGEIARNYLSNRGVEKKQIIDFKLGYAPQGFENTKKYLLKKGYKESFLVKASLLIEKNNKIYDKFRNRIVFPIFDQYGDIAGFSARVIHPDDIPKYLNSSQTPVFQKSDILYGLFQAKQEIMKKDFVIIVEGNVDIISAHKVGVQNIVAPMGTAITLNHLKILKRYTKNIYFCFDSDKAGLNALIKAHWMAQEIDLKTKVISFQNANDLDNFIQKYSTEIEKIIKNAEPVLKHLINRFANPLDFSKAEDKAKFVDQIKPILIKHSNPIEKVHYAKEIASLVDVDEKLILDSLPNTKEIPPKSRTEINNKTKKADSESILLAFLIQYPYLRSIELDWNLLKGNKILDMISNILNSKDDDKFSLDQENQELLDEMCMYNLGNFQSDEEVIAKFKSIFSNIYKNQIKNELKLLNKEIKNKEIKNEDTANLLVEYNKLTHELAGLK